MQENRGPFAQGGANTAYARYFVGNSYLNMLSTEGVVIGNVTFEPGCRNNWHIHEAASGGGQILLCTSGRGWYQEWASPHANCTRATWSTSPPGSSTGTARPGTAGSCTWPWKSPVRAAAPSGWSLSAKRTMPVCPRQEHLASGGHGAG